MQPVEVHDEEEDEELKDLPDLHNDSKEDEGVTQRNVQLQQEESDDEEEMDDDDEVTYRLFGERTQKEYVPTKTETSEKSRARGSRDRSRSPKLIGKKS